VAPPAALAQIPRPILGFVGTLFAFLDFELLEAVARRHADKSMVLVGPIEAHAAEAVARLVALPNVHHVGSQPQAAIPAFVREFAVCLNPFVRGRVADSVSPLKVYEYLAAGRPVISSPMKALQMEEAGRVVAFGEDAAQFAAEVDRCLSPEVQQADQARRAAVAGYSWDALFERVDAACEAAFASRSVARAHGDGLARR
jgi:glycosyltransferase involved in cell wall biosynthesis